MKFEVEIRPDETTCIDRHGEIFHISAVGIIPWKKSEDQNKRYYRHFTNFYKLICAKHTKHQADEVEKGMVIIY